MLSYLQNITADSMSHFQSPIVYREKSMSALSIPQTSSLKMEDFDVNDILPNMLDDQREHTFKKLSSSYLKHRATVAEWILDLGVHFKLHVTTSHAAVAYLDRLQPNEKFCRFQWQMVAICCVVIASKYHECEEHVPQLSAFARIISHHIPKNVMLEYELWVLKQMGWKLNARTVMSFISSFMCDLDVLVASNDTCCAAPIASPAELRCLLLQHCTDLARFVVLDTNFKAYLCSKVAAAVLFIARRNLGVRPVWREELTSLTSHDLVSFIEIVDAIDSAVSESNSPDLYATPVEKQPAVATYKTPVQNQRTPSPLDDFSPTSIATISF